MERDWRIVVVPDDDASSGATVLSLFQGIVDHSFESTEPFSLSPETQDSPVQALVGKVQESLQDVPLTARLSEVVATFGMCCMGLFQSPPPLDSEAQ